MKKKMKKENDNDHVNANEIRFAQNLSFFVENHVENSKKPSKIKSLHCGKLCGKDVECMLKTQKRVKNGAKTVFFAQNQL